MLTDETQLYRIWGIDDVIYGPVDLLTLSEWVQEERVTAETWIFHVQGDRWVQASKLSELSGLFNETAIVVRTPAAYDTELISKAPKLKPGTLRRVKIFGGLADEQLNRLIHYMELVEAKPFQQIIRHGSPGDAMYLILQGEVRVRMMVDRKENIITTLGSGDFFGEIALFDHGPRSADVITNTESILLRFSAAAFEKITRSAPELASPFLLAMGKTLASRIRADNKRLRETIAFSRLVA